MPFEYLGGHFYFNIMKKILTPLLFVFLFNQILFSQIYINPIAGKQSHLELEINQIELTENQTIIDLKVTNKRDQGGWFCADKNIHIKNTNGPEKYQLINSENIPTCPNQHEFKNKNEILEFRLIFPKISEEIKFIDLIENCDNACFSFKGIILDNAHNEKIRAFETGFDLYHNNEFVQSIPYFEKVLEGEMTIETNIHGLSYHYLIVIYNNFQEIEKRNNWLEILNESELRDKKTILKELENLGIINE